MKIKYIFISFLIFFSINVYAENLLSVSNIKFQGLVNLSKDEALNTILFKIGSKVSKKDIKNSIHALFKTGKFDNISVSYKSKTIIFKVKEKPIIFSINVTGNSIVQTDVLKKYLTQLGIETGGSLNSFLINLFIQNIKNFYYEMGRYQCNVKILKTFSFNNIVNLKIVIYEGELTQVKSIKIIGNNDFSEEKLMKLFQLKDHKPWWNLLEKCTYYSNKLQIDLNNLKNFYLNKGYFYFHVRSKKINFSKDKKNVNILIDISEGKKYKISNFFINGDLFHYYEFIKKIVKIDKNTLYNQEKINLIVNNIKTFLLEHGYLNSKVEVNPEVNHINKKIVLNFNIDLKKRYFVNKIIFSGNELTQDKILRREIKQIEGEYFNNRLVESGRVSLEQTKYFRDVSVATDMVSNSSNKVNVIYTVKEKPTGSLNFGVGYGIDSGLSFNFSVSEDNLFGLGNSLKATAVKNNNQKYIDFSTLHPYFFSNNINFSSRIFYSDLKYNLSNISSFMNNTYGLESDLSFLVNDFNTINFGFGYTHNNIFYLDKPKSYLNKIKIVSDDIFFDNVVSDFTLNYAWSYENLKYLYFPISGNQIHISGKNTIPGSDNSFYKLVLDGEKYVPLNKYKNFILMNHVRLGVVNSFNSKKTPFYENFYSNSLNNVRGFRANTIGPKKIDNTDNINVCNKYKNNNICESIDSIGGNALIMTNVELITPIPFINPIYTKFFRSSFFFDAGGVFDSGLNHDDKSINLSDISNNISSDNNIYASIGFSFQWFSPLGPLVFSYAFPIQKNKNYQLEPFQFNIGKNW
ncbi:outer membrane protein assembly factor BamA [Buchnera aphidicola (Muscaphis stroyani)]|uniref:Outer membrane protein assembly factor BamA n=2 Tax=Buchnera aphidicola TaxID=9 RepID=A0A4D6Y8B9_9GAMM|nr:outer membrane protein assembly factor BamA [Buchnera aphidicola (Muscaphis stroyani)]